MAFRASNIIPAKAYDQAKAEALKLKNFCSRISAQLTADISAESLPQLVGTLTIFKNRLNSVRTVTGIVAYARDQEDDPTYDVAAEFTAVIALIDDAIATIQATNTNTLIANWTMDGIAWNTFTPAQTANLKADIDAIVAQVS